MNHFQMKMKQVRALQNNTGIQHLVNEAYRILENPVILYDADWRILAYTEGVVTDDPMWNNHLNDGTVDGNIDTYINSGFMDSITSADKVVYLNSRQLKYDRIFGKIFDPDGNLMAGVSIVASNKPLEEGDRKVTEVICKILSEEIRKIPYYQGYAQRKLETCINMLIDNELKDINERLCVSLFVEMVYKGLKNNLFLAVADIARCDPARTKLERYRDVFKQTHPAFKYSIYSNYIVIIASTDEIPFHPKKTVGRLNKLFAQDDIKVGISSRFENLFDLRKYYNEAVGALKWGLRRNDNRQIFLYGECTRDASESYEGA